MSDNRNLTPFILLIGLSLIWGTSFILIKQGLKIFSPDELGALRVSAASLFLLPVALVRLKELRQVHFAKLFLSGLMGTFFPAFLFAFAQTQLSSSIAGILNSLSPVWVVIMGALFFHQRFRAIAIVGILISFGGTILLTLSRTGGSIGGFNAYALLIVLACAFYGTNLNWVKFKIADLGSLTITSVALSLIGPLGLTYLFGFTEFTRKMADVPGAWRAFGFIVLLAFMSTAVATLLFNKLLKISTPLFASSVTYLMPIVSVLWGVLDNEHLFLGHFIGMACILAGVYLANLRSKP
ncbi:MAG TPA: DMT family transporter [Cyclobacteriaceae bacterium]|nr:DMT family transporter [Cyclobacteriaceae bacterium]